MEQNANVAIISGGYALLLVEESIGMYDRALALDMWSEQLVERCLAAFAQNKSVRQVVGIMAASTNYAKVFRRTLWPEGVKEVSLATPVGSGGGA